MSFIVDKVQIKPGLIIFRRGDVGPGAQSRKPGPGIGLFYTWYYAAMAVGPAVAGVAAGAFASCTPLVGFHFILSFVVAWVIGGSMIAAAIGTAVGNPLTFPLIWVSSFQVGELILGSNPAAASPHELTLSIDLITTSIATFWPTLKPMFLGGFVIGTILGGILYLLVRSAVVVSQNMRAERLARHAQERQRVLNDTMDA